MGKIALGVVLIGLSIVTGGSAVGLAAPAITQFGGAAASISLGQIALFSAGLALTGVYQLLAGNPSITRYENREAPEDRPPSTPSAKGRRSPGSTAPTCWSAPTSSAHALP